MIPSRRDFLAAGGGAGSLVNPEKHSLAELPDASGLSALASLRLERKLEDESQELEKRLGAVATARRELELKAQGLAEGLSEEHFAPLLAAVDRLNEVAARYKKDGGPTVYLVVGDAAASVRQHDGTVCVSFGASIGSRHNDHVVSGHEIPPTPEVAAIAQQLSALSLEASHLNGRLTKINETKKKLPALRRRFRAFFAEFQLKQSPAGKQMLETLDGGAFIDSCLENFEKELDQKS